MLPTKSILPNNPKEQGRTAQASLKAMNAAQKKAEQLGIIIPVSYTHLPSPRDRG